LFHLSPIHRLGFGRGDAVGVLDRGSEAGGIKAPDVFAIAPKAPGVVVPV
jgi:hypothetical protein